MYPEDRLYNIQNNEHYFHTGHLPDGHQVLLGVQMPEVVLLMFGVKGDYLGIRARNFSDFFASVVNPDQGTEKIQEEAISYWQKEIGYSPGTIHVKRFFLPELWIGIREIPEDYEEEALTADFPDEEAEEMREVRRQWYEDQSFVLWFTEDYYMSEDGDVASS